MKLSDLQYLMHQLGPATPEIITIVQESIDSWMVEFDEGVALQVAWEERSGRALMKCAIGQPDEGAREEIYRSLLNANLQLTGVADVKLGLSDVDEDVMLIGEYEIGEEPVEGLRKHLSEFLGYAESFSQMIAGSWPEGSLPELQAVAAMNHDRA